MYKISELNKYFFLVSILLFLITIIFKFYYFDKTDSKPEVDEVNQINYEIVNSCNINNFDNFNNERGTDDGCYLVPNYVHFVRFQQNELNFVDAVCILSALKNQNPDKIFIHSDIQMFTGKYWEILLKTPGFLERLEIIYMKIPTEIFGQKLNRHWLKYHGGDVARLKVLLKYGGIFLDNDSYIVRNLNEFRKYEMTLGWMEGESLANQVIITHKSARFLKLWFDSYKEYNSSLWFYNAAIKPTSEILQLHPEYIHREKLLIANDQIILKLFNQIWPEWKTHYGIHLLIRHQYLLKNISSEATFPVKFDENNIHKYPITFRDMVYDVYPFHFHNDTNVSLSK